MSGRRPRWWAGAAAAAAVLAGLAVPFTASPAAAVEPSVTLTAVGPAVLTPESTLSVVAEVGAGDQAVPPGSRVELRVQRSVMSTRGSVAGWTEQGLDDPVGSLLATVDLPDGLPAGGSAPVSLQVPPGETGLLDRADAWGPRGLSVVLRSPESARLGVVRSHVVWYPADAEEQVVSQVGEPLGVTVVVPLTGLPPDPATGVPDPVRLAAEVAGGGRLDAVLGAAGRSGTVLALDPAVLDLRADDGSGRSGDGTPATTSPPTSDPGTSAPPTSAPPTSDPGTSAPPTSAPPTSAPPTSAPATTGTGGETGGTGSSGGSLAALQEQWRQRVDAVASQHETFLLGYGDPDLAALAHAGQGELARLADDRARETAADALGTALDAGSGTGLATGIGWPVGGDADRETLDLLAGLDRRVVLLDQSAQPTEDDPPFTPDGRGQVATADGTLPTLLSDSALGGALAAVDDTGGAAAAVQRLLAETAVIALERPSTSRHVLVAAPRDWSPDAADAVAAVDALTATPWTRARPLQGLVDADPPDIGRTEPTLTDAERQAELGTAGLERVGAAVADAADVADAFADPEEITGPTRTAAVALASAGWRGRQEQWDGQVAALRERVEDVRDSVHVVQGSTLTQVSRSVRLPVTVQNDSDQEVTVRLDVVPRSSRLVVTGTVDLTVAPGASAVGYVPVRGVGNGDTSVLVRLRSPSGAVLGEPVQTRVLVRADWESWGAAAVGGAAALLLVVGLVRTYRRGPVRRGHDPVREAASS